MPSRTPRRSHGAPPPGDGFRVATAEDLVALLDLEREANLVGLRHVFPPERYPFPEDDVLARWALVLDEPGVTVLVQDATDRPGLDVLAAYDDRSLRHLAVHPDRWGRGLARRAVAEVVLGIGGRCGSGDGPCCLVELWCLVENHRARALYEHLGWQAAPDRREAPWPPHPTEMRYTRRLDHVRLDGTG